MMPARSQGSVRPISFTKEHLSMPIPWLSILQNVPWSDVIENAPKVAEGARKLWQSVSNRKAGEAGSEVVDVTPVEVAHEVTSAGAAPATWPDAAAWEAMEQRSRALEQSLQALIAQQAAEHEQQQQQMRETAALLESLAGQNERLIAQTEAQRVALRRLSGALVVVGVLAVVACAMWWLPALRPALAH
jgi:hypothetical protein